MIKQLQTIVKELNTLNMQWAFLRESDVIKTTMYQSDVDIWIDLEHIESAIYTLSKLQWVPVGGREINKFFQKSIVLRFQHLKADFILEVWFGHLRSHAVFYASPQKIKRDIQFFHEIPFVSGPTLLNILTIRPILKDNYNHSYQHRARKIYHQLDEAQKQLWRKEAKDILGDKIIPSLESSLCQYSLAPCIGKWMIAKTLMINYSLLEISKMITVVIKRKLLERLNCHTVVISFVGTDGSGKSTLLKHLQQHLQMRGFKTESMYFGRSRGNTKILTLIRRFVLLIMFKHHSDSFSEEKSSVDNKNSRIKIIATLLYFMEYWFRMIMLRLQAFLQKTIILLDRGPLDLALIDGASSLPMRLGKITPKADLTILCDADPFTIRSRKNERSIEDIERHQRMLKNLLSHFPLEKRIKIDTKGAQATSINTILTVTSAIISYKRKNLDRTLLARIVLLND